MTEESHVLCVVGVLTVVLLSGCASVAVEKSDMSVGSPVTGTCLIGNKDLHLSCCNVSGSVCMSSEGGSESDSDGVSVEVADSVSK